MKQSKGKRKAPPTRSKHKVQKSRRPRTDPARAAPAGQDSVSTTEAPARQLRRSARLNPSIQATEESLPPVSRTTSVRRTKSSPSQRRAASGNTQARDTTQSPLARSKEFESESTRQREGGRKRQRSDDELEEEEERRRRRPRVAETQSHSPSRVRTNRTGILTPEAEVQPNMANEIENVNNGVERPTSSDLKRSYESDICVRPPHIAEVNKCIFPPPVLQIRARDPSTNHEIQLEGELNYIFVQVSVMDEAGSVLVPPHIGGEWTKSPLLIDDPGWENTKIPFTTFQTYTVVKTGSTGAPRIPLANTTAQHSNGNTTPAPIRRSSEHRNGSFVMFPNLILRKTGDFRLKFDVYESKVGNHSPTGSAGGEERITENLEQPILNGARWVSDVVSQVVKVQDTVVSPHDMDTDEQNLLNRFREQGIHIPSRQS